MVTNIGSSEKAQLSGPMLPQYQLKYALLIGSVAEPADSLT